MSVLAAISGALAAIFSFEKSRKWIIREGLTGISRRGSGRLDGERLEEVAWVAHAGAERYPAARSMSRAPSTANRHDQAAREASGARPYGRYLEEFEVGAVYKHWPAKTVTEADDHLFCLLTMNHHPLHINDVYAAQSQQGRNVVVGPLVYSLALGMSVGDVSGKAIANLATEELRTRRRSSTATRCSWSPRCSRSSPRGRSRTAAWCGSTRGSTSRTARWSPSSSARCWYRASSRASGRESG